MSTHNIGFYEDLTKIIFELSSNIIKYVPYFFCWIVHSLHEILLIFYESISVYILGIVIKNKTCQSTSGITRFILEKFLISLHFGSSLQLTNTSCLPGNRLRNQQTFEHNFECLSIISVTLAFCLFAVTL